MGARLSAVFGTSSTVPYGKAEAAAKDEDERTRQIRVERERAAALQCVVNKAILADLRYHYGLKGIAVEAVPAANRFHALCRVAPDCLLPPLCAIVNAYVAAPILADVLSEPIPRLEEPPPHGLGAAAAAAGAGARAAESVLELLSRLPASETRQLLVRPQAQATVMSGQPLPPYVGERHFAFSVEWVWLPPGAAGAGNGAPHAMGPRGPVRHVSGAFWADAVRAAFEWPERGWKPVAGARPYAPPRDPTDLSPAAPRAPTAHAPEALVLTSPLFAPAAAAAAPYGPAAAQDAAAFRPMAAAPTVVDAAARIVARLQQIAARAKEYGLVLGANPQQSGAEATLYLSAPPVPAPACESLPPDEEQVLRHLPLRTVIGDERLLRFVPGLCLKFS